MPTMVWYRSPVADDSQPVMYRASKDSDGFSPDAIFAAVSQIRKSFCSYIDEIFGEGAALVKGMLINDRSDISSYTRSQFSRAGVSHLLAVSGLHVSLILGSAEILLKKLFVPRKARIVVLVLGGLVLLALTDFSASAVRAVLMLFGVYLGFLLSEESDALTSLFASVALIILLSPYSVADKGLWLSFGATLGLVSVYPYFDRMIQKCQKQIKKAKPLLSVLFYVLRALLITLVANIFVLPFMWCFFGEISLAAFPCNLLLTPLTAVFLPLCLVCCLLGRVGVVGALLANAANFVGRGMLWVVSIFADLRGATLSLKYPFAAPLIIAFTVALVLCLTLRFKKKILIALPPAALVVCFAVALGIFNLCDGEELKYVGRGDSELIIVERAGKSSVCDASSGHGAAYSLLSGNFCEYSTEIENYVITDPTASHARLVERICERVVIRNLYLPLMSATEKLGALDRINQVAQKYGVRVSFYHSADVVEISESTRVALFFEESGEDSDTYFCLVGDEPILTYTDAANCQSAIAIGSKCRYLLLGAHGNAVNSDISGYDLGKTDLLVADGENAPKADAKAVYLLGSKKEKKEFFLTLE